MHSFVEPVNHAGSLPDRPFTAPPVPSTFNLDQALARIGLAPSPRNNSSTWNQHQSKPLWTAMLTASSRSEVYRRSSDLLLLACSVHRIPRMKRRSTRARCCHDGALAEYPGRPPAPAHTSTPLTPPAVTPPTPRARPPLPGTASCPSDSYIDRTATRTRRRRRLQAASALRAPCLSGAAQQALGRPSSGRSATRTPSPRRCSTRAPWATPRMSSWAGCRAQAGRGRVRRDDGPHGRPIGRRAARHDRVWQRRDDAAPADAGAAQPERACIVESPPHQHHCPSLPLTGRLSSRPTWSACSSSNSSSSPSIASSSSCSCTCCSRCSRRGPRAAVVRRRGPGARRSRPPLRWTLRRPLRSPRTRRRRRRRCSAAARPR